MDVWIKAEPEAHHMIGLTNGNGSSISNINGAMQYAPYENFTHYPPMPPNPNALAIEPPVFQYPPNGYDHHQHQHHHHQHNIISPHHSQHPPQHPSQHPPQHPSHSQQQYYHQPSSAPGPGEIAHHHHSSTFEQSNPYEELDPNQKYEYHEPDENFISIDDAKVRSFLVDLVQKETKKKQEKEELEAQRKLEPKEEADDEVKLLQQQQQHQQQSNSNSGDVMNESDESTIQEVDYDEDGEMVLLDSDVDYIDENEEGIELNWIDLEQKAQKQSIECFLCGKSVASSYNLRRHMMIHTGERPFGCDMCYKRFREFSDLKKHRRIHSTQMNFKCMVCRVNDPSTYDPTKCVACDKSGSGDGIQDMADLLLDSVPNRISPLSGGGTKKEFQCPMCSRIFGTRHNLKRHFMIHTGEKPFSCTICQKPFREVSTLKKHMHTHNRVKVYKCSSCREKFTDYDSFLEHKDTHHPKRNSPNKRMRGLKGHEMQIKRRRSDTESALADDDEEFECPECGEKSTSIELYADHIKQHDSSVEFQCYICKQMFESRDLLVAHFSIHDVDDESSADA
ncbi:zinc finger protein 271 [Eupeodes corollae]|uniref:zinc finger protein 271 n=1 Tax=Eupeodes corollae TaxID=290404 RepID=UPI0024929C9F|nr:zinc finger protein 271 [Eupeodes corollae]